ncbi:MAG TPA: CbtB-domain containing protein [Acidimicrobiia bacterium]|nr:CbtB-domain containing protein [Acidimicrobiia bacterium]
MAQSADLQIATLEPIEDIGIHIPAWAWMLVAISVLGIYLMTLDNAMLGSLAEGSHELFHDARHFVGVPCH